jgi:hypothetical protein
MVETMGCDGGGVAHGSQVADLEAAPVQAADAAGVVAPGNSGAEGEFFGGVPVGAGEVDLAHHGGDAGADSVGSGILGGEEFEELLGCGADVFRFRGTARGSGDRSGRLTMSWTLT